jgi:cytochrome c oxidase assembly protein subunit 15
LLFLQIALGGWVSSNYAGVACIGFPRCNGAWVPSLQMSQGFYFLSPVGANYQGGVLDNEVRSTIQFIHRLGAYVVATYLLLLCLFMARRVSYRGVRYAALAVVAFVVLQFSLGVINVMYLLPLWIAVAHNGVAAMLFVTLGVLHRLLSGSTANAVRY